MNNMQKSFKTKSKLRCMAEGGAVDPKTQLGILGGDKTVGPGTGAKGTETIFKSTVGGVPTFTDQAARLPGSSPYTQNAAQPMGNFATNQAGRTVTPAAPVTGAPPVAPQPNAMMGTASALGNVASALPIVGPAINAGKAALGSVLAKGGLDNFQAAAKAQLSPVLANSPLKLQAAQSPYEKMTGQAAGATGGAPSKLPSWATGPRDGSVPFTSGPVGSPQVPPVASMPAPSRLRPAPIPMDYMQQSGGFGPTKMPEDVSQLASGGHVTGPGGPTEDKIPALLSNGEYVLPADTVKAVGKENLDALRAKTHEFVGGPKTRRGLRKYADAGLVFGADDLNDELDRTAPKGKGLVRYGAPGTVDIQPDKALTRYTAPAATAPSALARGAAGFAAPAAALGALSTLDDSGSFVGNYDNAMGLNKNSGQLARTGSDAARVMESAGNAIGFGLPGRLGRGIANAIGGESFIDGVMEASPRDQAAAADAQARAAAAAAVARENSALRASVPPEAAKLSVAPQQARPVAPEMNELQREALAGARSALGRSDRGGFRGHVNSNSRDINKNFDALAKQLGGMYSSKGQGNLAKHLVDIERARAAALGDDNRTLASVVNNNVGATSSLRGQQGNQRASALSTLAGMGNTQAMGASNSLLAQSRVDAAQIEAAQKQQAKDLEAQLKAVGLSDKQEEDGLKDIRTAIAARFGDDEAGAQSATARIMSAGEEQIGRVMALRGQERAAAIEDLLDSSELATQMDANTTQLWGAQLDSGLPRITEQRDPRFFEDVKTRGVLPSLAAEFKQNLTPFNADVVVDDNGRAMPIPKDSRLRRRIDRDKLDADRRRTLRDQSRNQ